MDMSGLLSATDTMINQFYKKGIKNLIVFSHTPDAELPERNADEKRPPWHESRAVMCGL